MAHNLHNILHEYFISCEIFREIKRFIWYSENPNFYYKDKRSRQRALICACFDSFIILSEVAMPFNFELAISTR